MPAPDDVEGWKAVQAAKDKVNEATADKKAEAFGVTYEEGELDGIPVVEVTPSKLASKEKIAVYTHGGAYVLNSAKSVIESAMFFASETGLRVIAVDYTLSPHSRWQQTTDEVISVSKALARRGISANDIYQGMPHVFVPTLPDSKESRIAIAKVREWTDQYLLSN